jgi:diguanylate cyclase (GGDEF)-like protein
MKILIAEDDVTSRRILTGIFTKWGYQPVPAVDGNEAWAILREPESPKLAIIDWVMPGMDGIELCRKLRLIETSDPVYIILLTSRGDKQDIVIGLEAGANDYISKPYDNGELRARAGVGRRMVELQHQLLSAKKELKYLATHDFLTGAPNRRAVLESLEKEISRAGRENALLSVGLCDVDYFKQINDTWGHQVGDEVLQEIVRRIRTMLRCYDHVGRYGGEEFLVVVPYRNRGGEKAFERLRKIVADQQIPTHVGNIPVTISIGVVTINASVETGKLLKSADKALYQAKDSGRNRVVYCRFPTQ